MVEELNLKSDLSKEERYQEIFPQIQAIVEGETDVIANMANVAAVLKEAFGFLWVGFYIVRATELVLGPFQGPLACTRISFGKGVCGSAWQKKETVIVPDVEKFPGHIACSSKSRSEIVVPLIDPHGLVWSVLDVDSESLSAFDETDQIWLEKIVFLIEPDLEEAHTE